MCLEDNKHITTTIQVIGDACQDIVSFHDLNKSSQEINLDIDKGKKKKIKKLTDLFFQVKVVINS